MQGEGTPRARRGALWLGLGLAFGLALTTLAFTLRPPLSGIEASPARAAQDGEHNHADHDHASTLGPDGRFTGPGEVWPPQVRGATDIVALDFTDEAAPTSRRAVEADEAAAMLAADAGNDVSALVADERVDDALGQRYVLVSLTDAEIAPGSVKGDPEASLALFYSHDRASTVEVYHEGARVIDVVARPADEEQPPLGVDEKFRAGELARAHWEEVGDERIDQLEPYVILAVEPGGRYYDSRVAYVSFHIDNVARPELLTWVDLTDEIVLDGEVDR